MPKGRSRKRDYRQEYRGRVQRAIERGFTSYPQERKARAAVVASYKSAGVPPPSPRTKEGKSFWKAALDVFRITGKPPAPPPVPKVVREEPEAAGRWKERDVRFVLAGEQWSKDQPLVEYRGVFMTKEEAITYITEIQRARHVLVVKVVVNATTGEIEYEVWLDTESV